MSLKQTNGTATLGTTSNGTCYSVIATIQIVPDDKPIEPSAAVTDTPVQPS
jgi:hypothetical protein